MTQQQLMIKQIQQTIANRTPMVSPVAREDRIKELTNRIAAAGGLSLEGFQKFEDADEVNLADAARENARAEGKGEKLKSQMVSYGGRRQRIWYSVR